MSTLNTCHLREDTVICRHPQYKTFMDVFVSSEGLEEGRAGDVCFKCNFFGEFQIVPFKLNTGCDDGRAF